MEPDPFEVFDAHVHVGAWLTPDFVGRKAFLDEALKVMRESGVTGALVMPTDAADNARLLSDLKGYEVSNKGPKRLFFALWVKPTDLSLRGFIEANAHEIAALKVHPSFNRLPITDKAYAPFLKEASRRSWPVIVHCGRWREVAGYEHVLEVAEKYPDVAFIMSHMGGDSPGLVLGAASEVRLRGLQNLYFGTESIREYWLVGMALDLVGPKRLVFGSDFNLNHPLSFLAVINALGLSKEEKSLILGKNARGLLCRGL